MIETDYVKYALKHYSTPLFNDDEFIHDLNKVIVLKKLFRRYVNSGNINERLVLNNLIILLNVFGVEAANTILFFKTRQEHWSILKTFLTFLDSYKNNDLTDHISLDDNISRLLENIKCRSFS